MFRASLLSEVSGITKKRIQNWSARGMLSRTRVGVWTFYSMLESFKFFSICGMLEKGARLSYLEKEFVPTLSRMLYEAKKAPSLLTLVVTGNSLLLSDGRVYLSSEEGFLIVRGPDIFLRLSLASKVGSKLAGKTTS